MAYRAGDLHGRAAAAFEEHLFVCGDCARRLAELDALVRGVGRAVRSGAIATIVDEAVLNRLARDGVAVRSFALSPGDTVPCAVWDDDELMALRLRGDFGDAGEVTLSQRVAGTEVVRATGQVAVRAHGELIYTLAAAWVRQLPVAEVQVLLTKHEGNEERTIGSYTLVHEGSLRR